MKIDQEMFLKVEFAPIFGIKFTSSFPTGQALVGVIHLTIVYGLMRFDLTLQKQRRWKRAKILAPFSPQLPKYKFL